MNEQFDLTPENQALSPPTLHPSWAKSSLIGLQHAILVITGVSLVPAIITQMFGLPLKDAANLVFATMLGAGLGTLFQVFRFGRFGLGQVMFMGTAGAYLACAHSAVSMGGLACWRSWVY